MRNLIFQQIILTRSKNTHCNNEKYLNLEIIKRSFVNLAANVWRYEKLPIAGDFLSSYTKVEAGYNP
jgi:hypothetical protein